MINLGNLRDGIQGFFGQFVSNMASSAVTNSVRQAVQGGAEGAKKKFSEEKVAKIAIFAVCLFAISYLLFQKEAMKTYEDIKPTLDEDTAALKEKAGRKFEKAAESVSKALGKVLASHLGAVVNKFAAEILSEGNDAQAASSSSAAPTPGPVVVEVLA